MSFKSAADALVERVIKKFELKDLIKHKTVSHKNLFEIMSQYPSNGIDFKVWRKTWPKDSYYIIKETEFKDFSHGKAFGILTWNGMRIILNKCKGKVQDQRPVRMRNGNKRGTWRYSVNNSSVTLDNGLVYTAEEMAQYDPHVKDASAETAEKK